MAEEGFVPAVHIGTSKEQDIPLQWFDAFPGQWRAKAEHVIEAVEHVAEAVAQDLAQVAAVVAPAPAEAPAPVAPAPVAAAPAPEGDAA